jgi:hypothetical protein
VAAVGYPGNVTIWYPESVDVGYSQVLTGINLEFDPEAVEESFQPQAPSHKLAAIVVRSLPQGAVAFDAMGRKAVNPRSGVYFVRDVDRGAGDVARTRKVVIQN